MKIRVGVVGCGAIAQTMHLPHLEELRDLFEISALCDISPELRQGLARRYQVPNQYEDYRELLEQDLEAVLILNRDHAPVAVAAAEKGKHLFIEKPLCFNLEEADQILAPVRRTGVKLMVGYMQRFDPGFQRAVELFQDVSGDCLIKIHSSLGSPMRVARETAPFQRATDVPAAVLDEARAKERESLLKAISPEREALVNAYSMLLHLWSHDINRLCGVFGTPQSFPYAEARLGTPVSSLPLIQILAVLNYGAQKACSWETRAFVANEWWDQEISLFASDRTIRVRFNNPNLPNVPATVRVEETVDGSLVLHESTGSNEAAYKRELQHFHNCIVEDRQPLTHGEEAKQDLRFAIQMIEGCATPTV